MRHAVRPCSSTEAFSLPFTSAGATATCTQPYGSHGVDSKLATDAHSSPLGINGPKMLSSA
jgi:hypothetical protein